MTEAESPAFAARTACKCVALALVLSSTSGCYLTMKMWQVASRPVHKSRAVGTVKSRSGADRPVFALRRCPGREDGCYSCEIPAGWQKMPVKASPWGSDIVELANIAPASLEPSSLPDGGSARRVLVLNFPEVVGAKAPPRWFDDRHDLGVVYDWSKDGFAAHVFGYDTGNKRWVRLSEVPIDTPRPDAGAIAGATVFTPFTVTVDGVLWGLYGLGGFCAALGGLQGGGGYYFEPPDPPVQPPEVRARMLVPRLMKERPGRALANTIRELAGCGMHAKPAVPRLQALLEHPTGMVRLEAAEALIDLCWKDRDFYVPTLAGVLKVGDPEERCKAASALGQHGLKDAVPYLVSALRDADPTVRRTVARSLGAFDSKEAAAGLAQALADPDPHVRLEAAKMLGGMGPAAEDAAPALRVALKDRSYRVRRAAKKALKAIRMKQKRIPTRKARDLARKKEAVREFAKWRSRESIPPLLDALRDGDAAVRKMAAKALARMGPEAREVVPSLVKALEDDDPGVRAEAARALGTIGPSARQAVPALLRASGDESSGVSGAADDALRSIRRTTR